MIVLLMGSAPDVVTCRGWPRAPFDRIVAINNAWQVRPDWDHLVVPEDFPPERRPLPEPHQGIVEADRFVPAMNAFGGVVYAGGTMAFTAGYWVLHALRPRVLAYIGCDMVYSGGRTHFYGRGTADPLRPDITLRSLEAKSARLCALAGRQGCAVVNLSTGPSRLSLPRVTPQTVAASRPLHLDAGLVDAALAREERLVYRVPSGRYWEETVRFDASEIDALDDLWSATQGGFLRG